MKTLLVLVTITLLGAGAAAAQEAPPDSLALARQYVAWLYAGEADSLAAHTSESSYKQMAGTYGGVSNQIREWAGVETEVVEETWKLRNGRCQYWRAAQFSMMPEPLLIRFVLDADGKISGAGLGPVSQAPPVESETCAAPPATE